LLTASGGGGERDTSSEHGGKKWTVELPWQRCAEQTGSYEPVRHLGDRRLVSQLHSQVRAMCDRSDSQVGCLSAGRQVHGGREWCACVCLCVLDRERVCELVTLSLWCTDRPRLIGPMSASDQGGTNPVMFC